MSEQAEIRLRQGLIVWLTDSKHARQLERYGTVQYVSRRYAYAVLYVHAERTEEVTRQIQKVQGVKRIELSHRNEIWEQYKFSGIALTSGHAVNVSVAELPSAEPAQLETETQVTERN